MDWCATQHLCPAPPLAVSHWGEYLHHGNLKCGKSESPPTQPPEPVVKHFQQVSGYNSICLVESANQENPKCEVHTVTLPLFVSAGQITGVYK